MKTEKPKASPHRTEAFLSRVQQALDRDPQITCHALRGILGCDTLDIQWAKKKLNRRKLDQ